MTVEAVTTLIGQFFSLLLSVIQGYKKRKSEEIIQEIKNDPVGSFIKKFGGKGSSESSSD